MRLRRGKGQKTRKANNHREPQFRFCLPRDPAIRKLYLSNEHDQIPDNIVECWATCYWCFQSYLQAPISPKEKARISQHIHPIASYAYRMTLPTSAELLNDDMMSIIEGMNNRYAENFGIMPEAVTGGHCSLVDKLFESPLAATMSPTYCSESDACDLFPRISSRAFRARRFRVRMSLAVLLQMNGLGLALCCIRQSQMVASSSPPLV